MPRQKTKHTQIPSEKVRKSTFKRRLDSLFKKAHELSILCGVEVVVIVHDRRESHSTLWPSQEKVMSGVVKFLTIPERERLKKMVLQEKFLMDKLKDTSENLLKLQKKNEETEMGFLMNQLIDGTVNEELDIRQLNGLGHFVSEKLKKLQSRNEEFDEGHGQTSNRDVSRYCQHSFPMTMTTMAMRGQESGAFATTSNATLLGDMREDKWFGDTMLGNQNNYGRFRGIHGMKREPTEAMRPFIGGNQGDVLDDFGNVWRNIFSP